MCCRCVYDAQAGTRGRALRAFVRPVLLELLAAADLGLGGHPHVVGFRGMAVCFPSATGCVWCVEMWGCMRARACARTHD